MDYEQDLTIDESALDVEWLQQARLMMQYGRYCSECKLEMDKAKEHLEVTKAELDKDIRANPDSFDLTKITEGVVSNTIILQPEHQEALDAYLNAKYEFDMALNAVRAIDQKKAALENLVRLHGQQYFAGPNVPRDISHEWEQKQNQKSADTKISGMIRKKSNSKRS